MALAESNGGFGVRQRRFLTAIVENLDRMAAATQEFHEFTGRDILSFDEVSLRTLIEEALSGLSRDRPEKRAFFQEDAPAGSLSTMGDRGMLASAVSNFLRGAVQFTGETGAVEVCAREENENIFIEFSATRNRQTPGGGPPDLSQACKLWRLHGGRVYTSQLSEGSFLVGCELPVLRVLDESHVDERPADDLGDRR